MAAADLQQSGEVARRRYGGAPRFFIAHLRSTLRDFRMPEQETGRAG